MDAQIPRSFTNTIENDCVSLEKISDPTHILQESSHSLRGTETPDLQRPLTPTDDDYIHVPATIPLALPHELVERILLFLDTKSLLKCRLINREFNAIIQSSILMQYHIACKSAGVIDNPESRLSYGERLETLKKREEAWRKLKPVFETTIQVNDQPWTLYELNGGNYFLNDSYQKDLYYCHLPSSPQDNPQWSNIPGHGRLQSWSGSSVGMGMAVYEHDLIVNVISTEVGNHADMQRHSLDLVLLTFSTGEYHSLARHPRIHVQKSPSVQPYINIKIVGDSLALVVHDEDGSKLLIFDWKTGHKRLQHKSHEAAYDYSTPVFVSPELLLVPNRVLSHFEVWHLFPSLPNSNSPVHILSLQIPTISHNYFITRIDCHGEPSPFLHSLPYLPPRPFFPSLENSIIIVNLMLRLHTLPTVRSAYKLIMHRCALLDMIQKWTSPSLLEQQYPLTWLTNEATVHKVADPDDGSIRLGARSVLVSSDSSPQTPGFPTLATPQISATSPTLHVSAIPSGSASSTSRYDILQVQWADWGPPISRWFQANETHKWWIHQSTGQRYVFLDPYPCDESKFMIGVADFNLHNIRRNADIVGGKGEDNGSNNREGQGQKEEDEEELEILDHQGEFSEEVYMGLKCVIYRTPGEYDFDAVMMDEERLLGLKIDSEIRVESIKVLYIG